MLGLTVDAHSRFITPAPLKPRAINYQVNDICNARCVMCNVWMRQRVTELTPDGFRALLVDEFFSEVQHLGITSGEPTLRSDLDRYYEAALDVLPKLQGGHFITNGFNRTRSRAIFRKVLATYAARKVSFGGMVSIDGVGVIHNRVRGHHNAFDRASSTLFDLRDAGIPVIACCTIVKENVYGLHELLDWAKRHGIGLRFRIAEFIDRLYVDRSNTQIRSFERREVKHLVAFFHYLVHFYETNDEVRRTYQSILSLLTGGVRLTSCPFQTSQAINIDCEGRFAHCAPHGTPHLLGSMPGLEVMRFERDRRKLLKKHCPQCIQDYHADWTPTVAVERRADDIAHQQLYGQAVDLQQVAEAAHASVESGTLQHILLVGLYGTETAGDIAILAAIVRQYAEAHPHAKFTLLSVFPQYTALTVMDLPSDLIGCITICDYSSENARRAADEADALIIAGGPLMDIPHTAAILSLFARFTQYSKPRIIEGCGIGPLNVKQYRENVIAIARMATKISVRDRDSAHRLQRWGIRKPIEVRSDPSRDYVQGLGITWRGAESDVIRCFLRELTAEYPQTVSPARAEMIVTGFVKDILDVYPLARIELLAMHYFPVGNDDRLFARQVARKVGQERVVVPMEPLSPKEIINQMSKAMFCVAMRFHAVVFAHTIGAPFIAIDYTAGGKIASFLRDEGEDARCFDFERLESAGVDFIRGPGRISRNTGSMAI